jgi:hypothetical protein
MAEGPTGIRQALRSEDQEGNGEDDDQVGGFKDAGEHGGSFG